MWQDGIRVVIALQPAKASTKISPIERSIARSISEHSTHQKFVDPSANSAAVGL